MSNPLDDPRFTLVPSGHFRERFGALARDAAHSTQKLCLVATDPEFLIELLYGLSLREDCFYVKYGTRAREGMYLGRCFLETNEAVSVLCQELKSHPRLMVSLQDDASFAKYRDAPVSADGCGVWDDGVEHELQVAAVVEAAFGRPDEAKMVAGVRATRSATVSLVARVPPQNGGIAPWPITGHVLLSPVTIDGTCKARGLGLGPLAVAPAYHRRGFGARLVEAALRRARLLGYGYVVVLGDPRYYSRFGFISASKFRLSYPEPVPDPVFMAIELVPGALGMVSGVVRYHPAFSSS